MWLAAHWTHGVGGHGVAVLHAQLLQRPNRVPGRLKHNHSLVQGKRKQ
jgi:hypothetical protein